MKKIEKQLIELIENESKNLSNDPIVQEFEKADKEFSRLVEEGFAKRRGNQLLSLEQSQLRTYTFNTSQ